MDMNTLRILTTVASFVVFIGIMVWVGRNQKNSGFKDAENLPFTDDQS